MTKDEIGRIIRDARRAAGLTQTEVAEALGRPQNTVSAWEMGRAQPDISTLVELFRMMGRSMDEAFALTEQETKAKLSAEALKFARDFATLDGWGQKLVRAAIKNSADRVSAQMRELTFELGVYFPEILHLLKGKKTFEDGSVETDVLDLKEDTLLMPEMPHKRMRFEPGVVPLEAFYGVVVPDNSMSPVIPRGGIAFIKATNVCSNRKIHLISTRPDAAWPFGGKILCRYYYAEPVAPSENHRPSWFHALDKNVADISFEEGLSVHGQVISVYNPVSGLSNVPPDLKIRYEWMDNPDETDKETEADETPNE